MKYRAVYLDRDGVLNDELFDYVRRPEELLVSPGAGAAVARLNAAGLTVAVVTNQGGVGRGYYSLETLAAIHQTLCDELATAGAHLDGIYACVHHPEAGCECRKPRPGLLRQAAHELQFDPAQAVLVGDTLRDLQAARAVGAAALLVRTGRYLEAAAELPGSGVEPDAVVDDLAAAVDWILAAE
ncbi:MAG: D-glycero-beta-D-manno-heptose 1,7-bisphosphate 7-phosphatase [Fimbriimonadaceae bacterium]|nr:D-glycero-beta-D-manno-heptose 1,7-bisphosphate 7-phosphatase [Fimbriimonadaceae bacterium]